MIEKETFLSYSDSPEDIIAKIAAAADISVEDIKNGKTFNKFVVPRHFYCYYARIICKDKYTDTQLADIINVSRSSIIISYNKINNILTSKQNIRKKYKDIYDKINPTVENTFKNKLSKTAQLSFVLSQLQEKCANEMNDILGDTQSAFYQKSIIHSIKKVTSTFRNYIVDTYEPDTSVNIDKLYAKITELCA